MREGDKQLLDEQLDLAMSYLAQIGVAGTYDFDIPDPQPDGPLSELIMAIKIVNDSLAFVARQRDQTLRELEEKLTTIERQREAIRELSTPVIQIWDQILVMPLVGDIDTARAQQIIDNLLQAIARHRASVAIIDITGVPMVDSEVANHLRQAIGAARLLGAEVSLSGVSPDNARTLVRLGIDLEHVTATSSLQAGLRWALQRNRLVVKQQG